MKNNLKKIREQQKLTQVDVAKALNITERHYQNIESGNSNGSIVVWEKLSNLFGETIDKLLKW